MSVDSEKYFLTHTGDAWGLKKCLETRQNRLNKRPQNVGI